MTFSTVSLRPYQEKAIDLVAKAMREGNRCVVLQLPTGSGKTRVATAIVQRALGKGNPVLFICDREELIEQTSRAFDEAGIPHGVIQGQHPRWHPELPVQIATAQTLNRRKWPDANLVIWDESHTFYADVLKKMESWNNVSFLGLTATPLTRGMGKYWDSLVVGATTQELIDAGYLCPFKVFGPPMDLSRVRVVAGEFHEGELSEVVNRRTIVGDVVKHWLSLGENRQTICFAVNVAHSKRLADEFNAYGIPAAHIDAFTDTDDRRLALRDFAEGRIRVISSVDILTKGYDQPQASCLIMARPTNSRTVYLQQAGRVLRTAEGKENAIILDHGGNTERHGFPSDPLPGVLDNGKRSVGGEKVEKERLPKSCSSCHFLKPVGVHECPSCGFKPERVDEVEATDDRLVEIGRVDTADKARWYSMLLHYARNRRPVPFKDGWASHKFKEKFGVWPNRRADVIPVEPDVEVLNYIKHLNIKTAKSKSPKPRRSSCRYCGSTDLRVADGRGPHHSQLRCARCDRHVQWLSKTEKTGSGGA